LKKLIYISPDFYFDNDLSILKELQRTYAVTWHAFLPREGARYSEAQVLRGIEGTSITLQIHWMDWRRRSLNQFFLDWSVLNQIRKEGADLVYYVDLYDFYWNLIVPFKLKRVNTVYAIHDVIAHSEFSSLSLFASKAISLFAKSILISWCKNFHLFSKSQFLLFTGKHTNKRCFYSQLPMKDFGMSTVTPFDKTSTCKFLFFGTIEYYKGLDVLISTFEKLHDEGYSNFSLTIAGQGKYWTTCEKCMKTPEIYDLRIGFTKDTEIAALFSSHHFLVLPYRDATQSGPMMIAFQYGLPIVASNVDGLNDLLEDNQNGFLFENNLEDSMKDTLKLCIEMSPENYSALKNRVGDFAKKHLGMDNIQKDYVRFFDSLV